MNILCIRSEGHRFEYNLGGTLYVNNWYTVKNINKNYFIIEDEWGLELKFKIKKEQKEYNYLKWCEDFFDCKFINRKIKFNNYLNG